MGFTKKITTIAMGIASGLALMTSPSWAATERTDVINVDGETFKSTSVDANGNAITDQAYDIYSYEYYNYGYLYRTVVTPGAAASVVAEFKLDQPDLVERTSTTTLVQQHNALYLTELTLFSPTGVGTISSIDKNIDGCKGKWTGDTVNVGGDDEPAFTFINHVAKCNDAGLTIIVNNSNASGAAAKAIYRSRIQELIGTKADGTGLKMKARSRNTDF